MKKYIIGLAIVALIIGCGDKPTVNPPQPQPPLSITGHVVAQSNPSGQRIHFRITYTAVRGGVADNYQNGRPYPYEDTAFTPFEHAFHLNPGQSAIISIRVTTLRSGKDLQTPTEISCATFDRDRSVDKSKKTVKSQSDSVVCQLPLSA